MILREKQQHCKVTLSNLCIFLVVFFVIPASAQSGKCGINATWSLVGGTLTISGRGSFDHYGADSYDAYRNKIQRVVICDGITAIGDHAFDGYTQLQTIEIPNSVTSIGFCAISECSSIMSLTIPNSVKRMKPLAVWRLDNLETIIVPDTAPTKIGTSSAECFSLASSTNLKYFKNNSGFAPFYLVSGLPEKIRRDLQNKFFSWYAHDKINKELEKWVSKGEFETTSQWHQRVNESSYKEKADELIAQAKEDFVKEKSPKSVTGKLLTYDADQGVFPVKMSDGNTVYVGVPQSDAPDCKTNWGMVKIVPQYGIVNDSIALLSCTFIQGSKTYRQLQTYQEDSSEDLAFNMPELNLNISDDNGRSNAQLVVSNPYISIDHSIDDNIPVASVKANKAFVVVIGNENYQRVAHVQYAASDAKVFGEYCQKALGIPQSNIRSYKDATYGTMLAALKDIQGIAKAYKGDIDVIFYYAGHGIPNENDQSAYLLPVDADGTQVAACLSTKKLYQTLNKLNARQVVVFMDACFSGAQRGDGMLAATRGVALKVKDDVPQGNMVVFTAANGQQTAYPYKEKGHGMFTYFILKKLQETKGDVTLGDLCEYVSQQVAQQSIVINRKPQTPTIIPSNEVVGKWEKWKLE